MALLASCDQHTVVGRRDLAILTVLTRLGLRTVGDLAHVPAKTLQRAVGAAAGTHLHELAWGRDPRRVIPDEQEKSTGHDRRPTS